MLLWIHWNAKKLSTGAAERMGDLLKQSAQHIIADEQAILDRDVEVTTRLLPPVVESRTAALIPPHRGTRNCGLIGFEVAEKRALARETETRATGKNEKAKQMTT